MIRETSVAPRERVSIVYKSNSDNGQQETELPFKLLILGDFTQSGEEGSLDGRQTIPVTKDNFDAVIKGLELKLDLWVDDKFSGQEEQQIPLHLEFSSLRDFEPDQLVHKIAPLKDLADISQALKSAKKTIASHPVILERLQAILADESRTALLAEALKNSAGLSRGPAGPLAPQSGSQSK
jgi:type VI secretion system protein ImpB